MLLRSPRRLDISFRFKSERFKTPRERPCAKAIDRLAPERRHAPADPPSPEDAMRIAHKQINAELGRELLDRILKSPPDFFERLIVRLLMAMNYGAASVAAGRAIGRSGDDGVDGVIDQDPLGLDRVYIQAKRYRPEVRVGPGAIRDFFGSLDMFKANKGIFVTTSYFSQAAVETACRLGKRIVLIDGEQLTQLMVKFNVGCRMEETLYIKRVDDAFFE